MPDPTTVQQPDQARFPGSVLHQLADLRAFREAESVAAELSHTFEVLKALQVLTEEVRQLRAAIEPSSSPLITGPEAVREFKRLQENHDA